ncbi:hypothetical protein HYY73_04450 [Candidatus Woesearchaeota archaeon]|nr:hypothetical protein [Candidatus Woesearchaeota archaeon]
MGLFNNLFGGKKGVATELAFDEQKRLQLWEQHVADYPKREQLVKFFSFANVDKALADLPALDAVLEQIEGLISTDLVEIGEEKKADDEILRDLERLASRESLGKSESLRHKIGSAISRQNAVLTTLKTLHNVLETELHAIRLIRNRPDNMKEILLNLFRIIFHHEAYLYMNLSAEHYYDKSFGPELNRIVRAILLEEELKKVVESDEDKFVRSMVRIFGREDSEHHYRKLGEAIYSKLAEIAGAPMPRDSDLSIGIKRLERLMRSDRVMFEVIKHERPKYSDEKIRWVRRAFREAYDLGHFMGLEAEFAT